MSSCFDLLLLLMLEFMLSSRIYLIVPFRNILCLPLSDVNFTWVGLLGLTSVH